MDKRYMKQYRQLEFSFSECPVKRILSEKCVFDRFMMDDLRVQKEAQENFKKEYADAFIAFEKANGNKSLTLYNSWINTR